MTRKHFEALAAAVRCARVDHSGESKEIADCAIDSVAERMATVCASFNPNFDRARFLKACGVEEGK